VVQKGKLFVFSSILGIISCLQKVYLGVHGSGLIYRVQILSAIQGSHTH